MLIGKSVPDSMELQIDKWQNCQWFTNLCISCPCFGRQLESALFCCVSECAETGSLPVHTAGALPCASSSTAGNKELGKHSTKILRNLFLGAVL